MDLYRVEIERALRRPHFLLATGLLVAAMALIEGWGSRSTIPLVVPLMEFHCIALAFVLHRRVTVERRVPGALDPIRMTPVWPVALLDVRIVASLAVVGLSIVACLPLIVGDLVRDPLTVPRASSLIVFWLAAVGYVVALFVLWDALPGLRSDSLGESPYVALPSSLIHSYLLGSLLPRILEERLGVPGAWWSPFAAAEAVVERRLSWGAAASCLALSAALMTLAVGRVWLAARQPRCVATRGSSSVVRVARSAPSRTSTPVKPSIPARRPLRRSVLLDAAARGVPLVSHPVVWRELLTWGRTIGPVVYRVLAFVVALLPILFGEPWQLAFALSFLALSLGVGAHAAPSIAEERARGTLEQFAATPLVARQVVDGFIVASSSLGAPFVVAPFGLCCTLLLFHGVPLVDTLPFACVAPFLAAFVAALGVAVSIGARREWTPVLMLSGLLLAAGWGWLRFEASPLIVCAVLAIGAFATREIAVGAWRRHAWDAPD